MTLPLPMVSVAPAAMRKAPGDADSRILAPIGGSGDVAGDGLPGRGRLDCDGLLGRERVNLSRVGNGVRSRCGRKKDRSDAAKQPQRVILEAGGRHLAIDSDATTGPILDPRDDRDLQPQRVLGGRDDLQRGALELGRRGVDGRVGGPAGQAPFGVASVRRPDDELDQPAFLGLAGLPVSAYEQLVVIGFIDLRAHPDGNGLCRSARPCNRSPPPGER